ncbi:MAG: hypothetical protein QXJ25_02755, partial [Candidatus Aenigmatarchaeota archaeon]
MIEIITRENEIIDRSAPESIRANIKRNESKIIREILICFISMLLVVKSNARKIKVNDNEIKM